jgi:uncharacterized paraquat-inducible protein A
MPGQVSFQCPECKSRLRASLRFVGRSAPCPRCTRAVTVPPRAPAEEAPVLVFDDGHRRQRH